MTAETRQSIRDLLRLLTEEQRRVIELRLAGLTDKSNCFIDGETSENRERG